MPPLEPDGRVRHWWDKEWEKAGRSEHEFNMYNRFDLDSYGDFVDWATKAKQSADEPPFKIALDLGCGIGATTRLLQDKNPDGLVIGIDYQETCIETATQLSQESTAHKQTEFVYGDIRDVERLRAIIAERLPSGQKPDLILCNDTLHELRDQRQRLRDWVSLLSDNGRLVLSWGISKEIRSRRGRKLYPRVRLLESAKVEHDDSGQEWVDMSTYHAWTFLAPGDLDTTKEAFSRLCRVVGVHLQVMNELTPRQHSSLKPTEGNPTLEPGSKLFRLSDDDIDLYGEDDDDAFADLDDESGNVYADPEYELGDGYADADDGSEDAPADPDDEIGDAYIDSEYELGDGYADIGMMGGEGGIDREIPPLDDTADLEYPLYAYHDEGVGDAPADIGMMGGEGGMDLEVPPLDDTADLEYPLYAYPGEGVGDAPTYSNDAIAYAPADTEMMGGESDTDRDASPSDDTPDDTSEMANPRSRTKSSELDYYEWIGNQERYEKLEDRIVTWRTNEQARGRMCREKFVQILAEVVRKKA